MHLTEEQEAIIRHGDGHARVSAVAGSGKTTAMIGRVRHLLQQGIAPEKILVLMFNRSAREVFAERLHRSLQGSGLRPPAVRTFHALGLRLVESFTAKQHLPRYRLVTEEFQLERLAREAMKKHAAKVDGEESWASKEGIEGFLLFLDRVKSDIAPPQEVFAACELGEQFSHYIGAYKVFESLRRAARIRFYQDLIHEPVLAMQQQEALADWVANHVGHILVDEYQDINEVQQQLLVHIAGQRAQVMVVGDVDQCIYAWRGAKPDYIVSRFAHDFSRPSTYTLSYSFRYGHRLALAANHLIANNRLRDRKLCLAWPANPDTRIFCLPEGKVHPVVSALLGWQKENRCLDEAVILVRIYAQSVPVELSLLEHNIPYRLMGSDTVFTCPEVRALLGYLRLCQGTLQESEGEGTGFATVLAMLMTPHLWLKKEQLHALAQKIMHKPGTADTLIENYADEASSPYLSSRILDLAKVWRRIRKMSPTIRASTVLHTLIEDTGLYEHFLYASRPALAENKIKTCQAFVRFAQKTGKSVEKFLLEIEELAVKGAGKSLGGQHEGILITSIHRAKGLEWPLVILPGLEEGIVPFCQDKEGKAEQEAGDIEDERRLFYVGMTRAKEQLCLTYPQDSRLERRKKAGDSRSPVSTEKGAYPASCFLYEANLDFSERLGGAILAPDAQKEAVEGADLTLGKLYLKEVQSGVRLKKKKRSGQGVKIRKRRKEK
ncbi:MAG: ATP-dependent helicase [Candidatus Electrothrix aestuarii]|uniref:DNA 3'-5' helicase n=1 Tax=Candidatus Electrothrix aestuarii TaxID=3062594 RepID=A0AAU8M0F1_9BACT|nr:ATP-dependent helicase [Candidatus Electrothrix aestuarii]